MRPSRDLTEITVGILARAARLYRVKVVGFVYLSNHGHLLLVPEDAEQLALFMAFVSGNLAREGGRLHGWREKFWGRRYRAIPVSGEDSAQVERLRYLLSQGCKEGLVRTPTQWPGASSVESQLTGTPLRGVWFNRSEQYEDSRRKAGCRPGKYEYAEEEVLCLHPLPAWAGLSSGDVRKKMHDLIRGVEREARSVRDAAGKSVLGVKKILALHPHSLPKEETRRISPRFHAATRKARLQLESAYREFVASFYRAVRGQLLGSNQPEFPAGSFPPRLPFARGRP